MFFMVLVSVCERRRQASSFVIVSVGPRIVVRQKEPSEFIVGKTFTDCVELASKPGEVVLFKMELARVRNIFKDPFRNILGCDGQHVRTVVIGLPHEQQAQLLAFTQNDGPYDAFGVWNSVWDFSQDADFHSGSIVNEAMDLGWREQTPAIRFDATKIQCVGNFGQCRQSGFRHDFLNRATEFRVSIRGDSLPGFDCLWNCQTVVRIPKFDPSAFGCFESRLGATRNHVPLVFSDGHENVNQKRCGVGVVCCDEIHFGILKRCDEVKIATQTVELSDEQGVSVGLTLLDGLGQNGSVGSLAGFDLNKLFDDFRTVFEGLGEVDDG